MGYGIRTRYLKWMSSLIFGDGICNYSELLEALNDIPFRYILEMDKNREMDGAALRYRFGYEKGISGDDISAAIGDDPCSVLEMMTALCLRCVEQILDENIHAQVRTMFCDMLHSLGIDNQTGRNIDILAVQRSVERFLDRNYRKDGRGGLFTVSSPDRDMRNVEIWYQMCLYLDERMSD